MAKILSASEGTQKAACRARSLRWRDCVQLNHCHQPGFLSPGTEEDT